MWFRWRRLRVWWRMAAHTNSHRLEEAHTNSHRLVEAHTNLHRWVEVTPDTTGSCPVMARWQDEMTRREGGRGDEMVG